MKASEIQYPIQLGYPALIHGVLVWAVKRNVRVGYINEQHLEKACILTPEQPELVQGAALRLGWRVVRVLKHDLILGRYVVAYNGPAVRWWLFRERVRRAVPIRWLCRLFRYKTGGKRGAQCRPVIQEESETGAAEKEHIYSDFTRDELRKIWERAEICFQLYNKKGTKPWAWEKKWLYDTLAKAAHNVDTIKAILEQGASS